MRGFGRLIVVCNYPLSYTCGNPSRKRHMSNKESRFAVNNIFTVAFCSKCTDVSCSRVVINGITLMGEA